MKKMNTSPISGMQELLPRNQAIFNNMKNTIREVYHSHGFLEIETPIIDRAEILFAKAGGETEKQIYKVVKTEETSDSADQALRFDHTVPLARYVSEHESTLAFPFKVTQIGRNFRGERAQKGRFREFYQCDLDIIGRNELPLLYDAEVILTLDEVYARLGLTSRLIRISNRKLLSGLLEAFNLNHFSSEIFHIVDRAEKISPEATRTSLLSLGFGSEKVDSLLTFMEISGNSAAVKEKLLALNIENSTFQQGISELTEVLAFLESRNAKEHVVADLKIVRGLDYYTGTVFETILPDHRNLGSIGGGGRYDNLASLFTDQILPGVGGSIGLTRLFYLMTESNLLLETPQNPVDVSIIPMSSAEIRAAFNLAEKMRASGRSVDLVLIEKKLSDRLKSASKISRGVIVIGESELETRVATLKIFDAPETSYETISLD